MMRFLLAIIALCAAGPALAVERSYSIFGFDEIRVRSGINVIIETGRGPSAKAEAETREILDRVTLRKSGNILMVAIDAKPGNGKSFAPDGEVTLRLSTNQLKTITHSGAGRVVVDKMAARTSNIRLSGFGSLSVDALDSDVLNLSMNGGGQVRVSGKADSAKIELLGSSVFDGAALTVDKLDLLHRGPASSHVKVLEQADLNNSGTGSILIDGRPNCLVRSSGSAQITCNPKG
ncbi:GIN domain-containing protein [Parasphingorhabdus halotolerans]|uniref:Putative auto-transporter adhesin head GIN domain-containing protein n=1 Tax=Parasphingorhabdus halotolerans TaxID=2725558 RepID=A0A6H2DNV6_9SPHN|nr:DUF2807 domain-containing protein [Parasphingorhabdus halotolerans]QJB70070.1 hypothetical protein HF685_12870 [Parasphingorhabdus halotolerans]